MKVKELIEMLKNFDPEAIVVDYNEDVSGYMEANEVKYTNSLEKYISLSPNTCECSDIIEEASYHPMMWHIYNMNHEPLCWEDEALEFDTREDAEKFLSSVWDDNFDDEMPVIVEDILYYDGGYLNASGCVVEIDENGEECLVAGE